MKLIESKTLASAAASIEFTSIPQDGTDLVVLISGRSTAAVTGDDLLISLNGSTANFTNRNLQGNGAAASSNTQARVVGIPPGTNATSNTFGSFAIYLPNYTSSTNKSISSDSAHENNATTAYQTISALLWSNTAAITSLAVSTSSGNLAIGSIASLYKITKGSDGIVTTS
jgi:hypothetical protein